MFNKIKNVLLSTFPDFLIRDGKPITDLLVKPAAAINEAFEAEKVNLLNKLSIANYSRLTSNEFNLLASNYINTERKLGRNTFATVRVYFTLRTDFVIDRVKPVFIDSNGNRYLPRFNYFVKTEELLFDPIVSKYYTDITVVSENFLGDNYLVRAGEINTYNGENPFVEFVANLSDTVLTDYQESNEDFYNRLTQNGTLVNPSRANYYSNLVNQVFTDIRKFAAIGSGDPMMRRDLTFNSADAELAITEYNFYRKKEGSKIDNYNKLYKGLLLSNNPADITFPGLLPIEDTFAEVSQVDYNAVAYNDNLSTVKSSLIHNDIFALYSGISDLLANGWFVSDNGGQWNKGSSFIRYTNDVKTGLEIKGGYVSDPTLIEADAGFVMYKNDGDPRNKEYQIDFIIDDFEYKVNNTRTTTESTRLVSNVNPIYFTVLKEGLNDLGRNMKSSTYDGYGVVIKKTVNNQQPNVFIVDGSSAVGEIAWEQQVLLSGSERVLAGAAIPLNPGKKYTCLLQINENYGLKVLIKNEFNAVIGQLSVGSGASNSDYVSTYESKSSYEEKLKTDLVVNATPPRQYKFITTSNEDLHCSSFLNLAVSVAKSATTTRVKKIGDRLLGIDINSNPAQFNDFRYVIAGDNITVEGLNYIVTNVFSSFELEVGDLLPDITNNGVEWSVWRSLVYNTDYLIPNKSFFKSILVTDIGITKILALVGPSKLGFTQLKFTYINKLGENVETILDWVGIHATDMVTYTAQPTPQPTELESVNIFDTELSQNYWFTTYPTGVKYQAVYLTQIGYDNLESNYLRFKLNAEDPYIVHKDAFEQGYYLPVPHAADVDKLHYIDSIKLKTSGYTFTKDYHYRVFNDVVTDVLVPVNFYSLFKGDIEIVGEATGVGYPEVTTIASNKGQNKIYISTGTITTTDYFSVLVGDERFFIQDIDLNSENSPYQTKKIEITLDRVLNATENITVKIRKKAVCTSNSSYLRFGYRYDIENKATSTRYWTVNDTLNAKTGSRTLVKNEDFLAEKNLAITKYYVSTDIFNLATFNDTDILTFNFKYRSLLEDKTSGGFSKFRPISSGTYFGIGLKTVNNGAWKILNVKVRQLLDSYSAFLCEFFVGEKPVTNEDRVKIKINSYGVNLNASTNSVNGSKVMVFNFDSQLWELLYEHSALESANKILQFYNGADAETRPYDFGYWDGSIFVSVNNKFYPKNYVGYNGNIYLLFVSRGKNEKNINNNSIFGEAKLYLDYINVIWQRRAGVHLGNKMDLWVASQSETVVRSVRVRIPEPTKTFSITSDTFTLPIVKIQNIFAEGSNIPIGFTLINNKPNLRFTTKEDLTINFTNITAPGNYIINFEYYPHLQIKQDFIKSLQSHIDILVRQYVPCFVKINLGYYGVIDVEKTVNEIYNYVRFSNAIEISYLKSIIGSNGAALTVGLFDKSILELEEHDLETDVKVSNLNFDYTLTPEKFFDIKLANINLIRLQ